MLSGKLSKFGQYFIKQINKLTNWQIKNDTDTVHIGRVSYHLPRGKPLQKFLWGLPLEIMHILYSNVLANLRAVGIGAWWPEILDKNLNTYTYDLSPKYHSKCSKIRKSFRAKFAALFPNEITGKRTNRLYARAPQSHQGWGLQGGCARVWGSLQWSTCARSPWWSHIEARTCPTCPSSPLCWCLRPKMGGCWEQQRPHVRTPATRAVGCSTPTLITCSPRCGAGGPPAGWRGPVGQRDLRTGGQVEREVTRWSINQ